MKEENNPRALLVIPGAPPVIPGLTRDLPPRRTGLFTQEIAGRARNDKRKGACLIEQEIAGVILILNQVQDDIT